MISTYITRLRNLGFKTHTAARLCQDIIMYIDERHLAALIDSLEDEHYVAK